VTMETAGFSPTSEIDGGGGAQHIGGGTPHPSV
jgi:hypothetical protein